MATGLTSGSGATTAAEWSSGLGGRSDKRRWHYRRSLASRVGLLTTIAVGITVAGLPLEAAAFAVVNRGPTALDGDAVLKIDAPAGETLAAVAELLG